MATTYDKIATTTLGSANATISFTSIGSGYTDLRLVLNTTLTTTGDYIYVNLNNDTANNYGMTFLKGDGSSATSSRGSSQNGLYPSLSTSGTVPMLYTWDIFSYTGSTYKTSLMTHSNDQNGSGGLGRTVGLWLSTSAVTRIDIKALTLTMAAGTTATLYGIRAA